MSIGRRLKGPGLSILLACAGLATTAVAQTATNAEVTTSEGPAQAEEAVAKKAKQSTEGESAPEAKGVDPDAKVRKTDAQWRKLLTREQYYVTRQKGTEPAYSGRYASGHFKGTFVCVGCGAPLFSSKTKFESGTGWPSFYQPIARKAVDQAADYSAAEARVEVMCHRCDAHLGHVFNDGPEPTGLRYCINSLAIKLKPTTAEAAKPAAKDASKEDTTDDGAKEKEFTEGEDQPAEASGSDTDPEPAKKKAPPGRRPSRKR